MLIAVSDASADQRRIAVAKVADSDERSAEWAVKGFTTIALLESDSQARCVAVRALAEVQKPEAVDALLKILNHDDHPPHEVRPPDAVCRWDALDSLNAVCAAGVSADRAEEMRDTFLKHLEDENRHVRGAAARGLGNFKDLDVLRTLIASLRDEDFAVAYACEDSLVKLTGITNGADFLAWRNWLEKNEHQPFAKAGSIPESRRKPYATRWGKAMYDTKQVMEWLFPGSKPQ